MREIKFRLWNKDSKSMVSAGSLFIDAYYASGDGCLVNKWFNQKDKIFLQFTGFKDKNGREIYEGDIVRYNYWCGRYEDNKFDIEVAEVKFKEGQFLPREHVEECEDSWYSYGYENFEVIGNIYENPELLAGKKGLTNDPR